SRRGLSAVEVPLLLATSRVDHTVPPTDSDIVAAGVRGPVERLALTRSHHLATLDHDAPMLFDASARLLAQHVPVPGSPRCAPIAASRPNRRTTMPSSPA